MNDDYDDYVEEDRFEDDLENWEDEQVFQDLQMEREDYYEDDDFADPGGNSALRAETPTNPRNLPCPTCGRENVLTPKDVAKGYNCDRCADRAEGCY